ncbi:MAG TPA: MBL fold metallo-hydrolase, partial [Myxococcota bacterium]
VDVHGKLLLVDGPRFVAPLVQFIEARGGLAGILLTHGDDVGDADRYAEHFGATVAIHADDARAAPFAGVTWRGLDEVHALDGVDVTVLPVPGHTRGSVMFLAGDRLFTGDSLAWDRERERMMAFHDACWFSWSEQKKSLARIAHGFSWILPGHGQRHRASVDDNRAALHDLVARM